MANSSTPNDFQHLKVKVRREKGGRERGREEGAHIFIMSEKSAISFF